MEHRLKILTFRVTLSEYTKLKKYADQNSLSMSDIIRRMVITPICTDKPIKPA